VSVDEVLAGGDELDEFIAAESDRDPLFVSAMHDAHVRGELIRTLVRARRESGMRQVDVAEQMGTTQSCVSDLESGERDPHFSTLQRYARAVGLTIRLRVGSEDGVVELMAPARRMPSASKNGWRVSGGRSEYYKVAQ
jgi:transcriptional regulator with XRE-family HTH domain